jgi:hypothetical protein
MDKLCLADYIRLVEYNICNKLNTCLHILPAEYSPQGTTYP